jgi:cell pole-organizing protein PopZ
MSQTAKAQEPSMEEILASIRRIIADDDTKPQAKAPEPPKPAAFAAPRVAAAPAPPTPPLRSAATQVSNQAANPAPNNKQDEIDAMLADLEPAKAQPQFQQPQTQLQPQPQQAQPRPQSQPTPQSQAQPQLQPRPPAPKPAPAASDVLDLTEAMAAMPPSAPPVPPPSFRTIDGASDVVFTERGVDTPDLPRQPAPPPQPPAVDRAPAPAVDLGLMSPPTRTAVESAFNSLANTVLGGNARTLEDLVKEMLRPMLKAWIDDNLPGMVDRIIRAEIERVARGR